MAVVCQIDEQYGNAPGTNQANIGNLNFGNESSYEIVVSQSTAIYVDQNAFEKWIKMSFTGVVSFVDNLKVWKSAGAYVTAEGIDTNLKESAYGGAETYATPLGDNDDSIVATDIMPVAEPSGPNLGISGALANQLTGDGDSDYCVMQLQTGATTPTGPVNQKTFTFQWDES